MASDYLGSRSGFTMQPSRKSCRTIREGYVQTINELHNFKIPKKNYVYAKAVCGSKEGLSARLEFYEDANSASTEDLMIWQILFTDVKYVCCKEEQQRKIITIGLEGSKESISFRICADSRSSTIKWYMYCSLLLAIPKYTIPEIPKENDALQQGIDRYSDSRKFDAAIKWVVHIVDEGVGHNIGFTGLCIVTISNSRSTFSVSSFYTGKCFLTWHRDDLKTRLSGCIESLIFLEADKMCYGGPGLLWMQHPSPNSMTLQKQLNEFLLGGSEENRTTSPINYILIGSAMGSAYIKNDTQLSQISYGDYMITDNSLLGSIPVSQSDASLSSECSQYSSGYYSDSSCGGSVNLKGSRLPPPKVTCKHLSDGKEYKKTQSSFTATSLIKSPVLCSSHIQTTSPTIGDDDICSHLPNSFIKRDKTASADTHKSKNYPFPLQSSSAKMSMIPKPSSGRPAAGYCASIDCYPPAAATGTHPSTLFDPNLSLNQKLKVCTPTTNSKHAIEKHAFKKCSIIIVDNLDISAIFPHLNSHGLLTDNDSQVLQNNYITNVEKAQYLLNTLPRKGKGFLDKFLYCLRQTKRGTGHGDIAKELSASYKDAKERNARVDALMISQTADC